jgi:hypothetical protein
VIAWSAVVLLFLALPSVAVLWSMKLKRIWSTKREVEIQAERNPRLALEAQELSIEFMRELLGAVVIVGGGVIALVWLIRKQVNWDEIGGGTTMGDIPVVVQRILVALVAFLIAYGLASAVLPQLFPEKGRYGKTILGELTGIALAGIFALAAATNESIYKDLYDKIVGGFSNVVAAFIGIMFAGIGAYLVWKKVSTFFRPVGGVRDRRLFGKDEPTARQ